MTKGVVAASCRGLGTTSYQNQSLMNLLNLWRRPPPVALPESRDQVPAFWLAIPFHLEGLDQLRQAGPEGMKLWTEMRRSCERRYFPDERFEWIVANEASGELTEETVQ